MIPLEECVKQSFSLLINDFNQPLNLFVGETICNVIRGETEQYLPKKYDYIGESATNYAISVILRKNYSEYNSDTLAALSKIFRDVNRICKLIVRDLQLREYIKGPDVAHVVFMIIGVLHDSYGMGIIEKLIENSVVRIANAELNLAQEEIEVKPQNPNYILHQLVKDGKVETIYEEYNQLWRAKTYVQYRPETIIFSHHRIGTSKQRARTEVAKDILSFLQQNPDTATFLAREPLSEEYPLPIPAQEEPPAEPIRWNNTNTSSSSSSSNNSIRYDQPIQYDTQHFTHIPAEENEDTLTRLAELLLEQPQAEVRSKKRPRNNPFDSLLRPETKAWPEPIARPDMTFIKSEPVRSELDFRIKPTTELEVFRPVFMSHRQVLNQVLLHPGQAKSNFLSLVELHKDLVQVQSNYSKTGSSHQPVFHADIELASKVFPHVVLKTSGTGTRKREAEQVAFAQLVELILHG